MKSDNHSKCTESNQRTVIYTEEQNDNSHEKGVIRFRFANNSVTTYDFSQVVGINPFFFSSIASQNQVEIIVPDYITPELLMEFIFIIKNGFSELEEAPCDTTNKVISLIKVSDFFQNESISVQLISDIAIEQVNVENAFDYLSFSYEKMNKISEANGEFDTIYFDLFYKCLETLGRNIISFLKNISKIKTLEKKVIDELIHKLFSNLITGKYILLESNYIETLMVNEIEGENYFETVGNSKRDKGANFISLEELTRVINFLKESNSIDDFFELLTNEYMSIFSSETINELKNIPNPTFQVKIPYDFENYYEEYPIDLTMNDKNVVFVIFYKKSDDTFNVCIKLSDYNNNADNINRVPSKEEKYCFKIFTFLSIVKLHNEENNTSSGMTETNLKSLSNNKSMYNIFKMSNFKAALRDKLKSINCNHEGIFSPKSHQLQIINDGVVTLIKGDSESSFSICSDDFFSVTILLKICYVHSVLASYLLKNFSLLSHQPSINKISKQLLILIIKNKYINKDKEDNVVIGLLNWLNNEINIKEDISELFSVIKWSEVSEEILFEFVIKYANMINEENEGVFIRAYQSKFPNEHKEVALKTMKNLIKTSKKIDYSAVYAQMKKNEKYNLIYFTSPKIPNCNCVNSKVKKDIDSNKNTNNNIQKKKKNLTLENDGKSSSLNKKSNESKGGKGENTTPSPLINFLLRHSVNQNGNIGNLNTAPNKSEVKSKQNSKPKKMGLIIPRKNNEEIGSISQSTSKRIKNHNWIPRNSKFHMSLNKGGSKRKNKESYSQSDTMELIKRSKNPRRMYPSLNSNQSFNSSKHPRSINFY